MGLKGLLFGGRSSASSTSSIKGHRNLKAHGYDSAVALEAPVRGSYPVAGNGPNVLDEIQRARAKKDAARKSTAFSKAPSIRASTADPPPDIARWRENTSDRPQTALHNRRSGGGQDVGFAALNASGTGDERTKSGFTTKSPPAFLSKTRRNSLHSFSCGAAFPTLPSAPPNPPPRDIKTYKLTKATDNNVGFAGFTPPFAQHKGSDSRMSHKSYVDLLDAHSNIRPSHEALRHRAKASGQRNYGEDVADRNITIFGGGSGKGGRVLSKVFDVNTPEFSYLKTLYSTTTSASTTSTPKALPKANVVGSGNGLGTRVTGHGKVDESPAAGAVLGLSQSQPHALGSDDILHANPISTSIPSRPTSRPTLRTRATTAESNRSGSNACAPAQASASASLPTAFFVPEPPRSRPAVPASPSSDTSSVGSYSFNTSRGRDDHSVTSNGNTSDPRVRTLSPLSTSTASVYDEVLDNGPVPPIPTRGRNRVARHHHPPDAIYSRLPSPIKFSNPVPVSITSSTPKPSPSLEANDPVVAVAPAKTATSKARPEARRGASVSFSDAPPQSILPARYPPPSLKDRKRTMSAEGHSRQSSPTLGHRPKNGSLSYSLYPNTSRGSPHGSSNGSIDSTTRPCIASNNKRKELILDGGKEPPNLKGVVDLSDTVDTVVITKKLPAVVHEHVTPTRHEIHEERITREIHFHNVYHRILPVIETIILPTKHYTRSPDGKFLIEIPEHDVPGYTGRPLESIGQGWKLVRVMEPPSLAKPAPTGHTRKFSVQRKSLPPTQNSQQFIEQFQSYGSYIHQGSGEGLANDDLPNESAANHERSGSVPSNMAATSRSGQKPGPVLTSGKAYITEEGFTKTEYFWRHPPVFEDVQGRTQPIYMRGAIGDTILSSPIRSSSDEEDANGVNYGALDPEGEMFRDSGYGEYAALPGLSKKPEMADLGQPSSSRSIAQYKHAPVAASVQTPNVRSILKNGQDDNTPAKSSIAQSNAHTDLQKSLPQSPPISDSHVVDDGPGEKIQLGRILDGDRQPRSTEVGKTGEATSFLRQLKEKRRSSGDSISTFFPGRGVRAMGTESPPMRESCKLVPTEGARCFGAILILNEL